MTTYRLIVIATEGSNQPGEHYDDLTAMQVMGQLPRIVELQPSPQVRIIDDTDAPATIGKLIAVAREEVKTRESLRQWARATARILLAITATWIAAAAYLKEEVKLPPEPMLIGALHERAPRSRNELMHFVRAARPSRTAVTARGNGTEPQPQNPQGSLPATRRIRPNGDP